ncbi:MAG: PilZ domain-containing protein [Pirellulaceae bacterium]|jgi:PilZ domain
MLSDSQRAPSPEIELIVSKIEAENVRYNSNERRSAHRTPLARPVTVHCAQTGEAISVFSQNISGSGISLVSQKEFKEGQMAVLQIHSLEGTHYNLLSVCRWCRSYGKGWFISGWMFQAVARR